MIIPEMHILVKLINIDDYRGDDNGSDSNKVNRIVRIQYIPGLPLAEILRVQPKKIAMRLKSRHETKGHKQRGYSIVFFFFYFVVKRENQRFGALSWDVPTASFMLFHSPHA